MKVFNNQPTPVTYGDGITIPGYSWAEGSQEDFAYLIDQGLVLTEPGTNSVPISTSAPSPEDLKSDGIPVVSPPNKSQKVATIKPVSDTSVKKES